MSRGRSDFYQQQLWRWVGARVRVVNQPRLVPFPSPPAAVDNNVGWDDSDARVLLDGEVCALKAKNKSKDECQPHSKNHEKKLPSVTSYK